MGFGETALAILTGLGLSVACGFRIFTPMLVVSIASYTGNLDLADSLAWLGELPALIAFGVATVGELILHYVPFLDNALDVIEAPLVFIAGTILSASVVTDLDPLMQWGFAAIAGGGSAELVKLETAGLRGLSTATTGGVGNPILATAENGGAVLLPIVAILLPVAILVFLLALVGSTALVIKKWVTRRRKPA